MICLVRSARGKARKKNDERLCISDEIEECDLIGGKIRFE